MTGQTSTARAQLDEQRAADYDAWIAQRRAIRIAEQHAAERDAQRTTALDVAAAPNARQRAARVKREAEALAARQRDEWTRANAYALTPEQLLTRCYDAAAAITGATDAERDDAAAHVMHSIARRYGWTPPAGECGASRLRQRAAGRILDERIRMARREQLPADEPNEDERANERGAIRRNVWAAFTAEPVGEAASSAPQLRADAVVIALAQLTGEHAPRNAQLALAAALNGYGSAAQLAVALDTTAGAMRVRLHGGRRWVREHATAEQLADAVVLAARLTGEPLRLTADERRARASVDRAKRAAARIRGAARAAHVASDAAAVRRPVMRRSPARVLAAALVQRAAGWTLAARLDAARQLTAPRAIQWADVARVPHYRPASRLRVQLDEQRTAVRVLAAAVVLTGPQPVAVRVRAARLLTRPAAVLAAR